MLDILLKLVPSILVVGGWVVVYQLQALQARRKLLREEMDKARDAVAELQEAALRFHMSVYSVADRMLVIGLLTDIDRRLTLFPRIATSRHWFLPNSVMPQDVTVNLDYLVRLRQAITLEHFDDPEMTPLVLGDPLINNITGASAQMVFELDRVFVAAID